MGGVTISCREEIFIDVACGVCSLWERAMHCVC